MHTRSLLAIVTGSLLLGCSSSTTAADGGADAPMSETATGDVATTGDAPATDADDATTPQDAGGMDAPPADAPPADAPPADAPPADDPPPIDAPPADGGALCGNGAVDPGEQCDRGRANSDTAADGCRTNCTNARCGDRVVDYARGEQCDDGNATAGDGCGPTCQRERPPTCGDRNLDIGRGEQCDDGNTAAGDGCSPTCQFEPVGGPACGDRMRAGREVCDDGNAANGDACNPTCNLTNTTSLFAGRPGMAGFRDGPAVMAQFNGGATLAVDARFLWIADAMNRRLRQIDLTAPAPAVVTVAGDGTMGNRDHGVGLMARFGSLDSVTTDGVTVWIGDSGNHTIRAVSAAAPHAVTTLAGSAGATGCTDGMGPAARFQDVRGLTYYAGNLYYVDAVCATLRRIDPANGRVTTIAGAPMMTGRVDGPGASARFMSPRYMASDNSGNLFIADTNGNQIRVYNTVTGHVGTFVGSGANGYVDAAGLMAQLHRPRGMTSDGTSVYWVEFNQHTLRQAVVATASVTTMLGMHCGGAATCAGGYTEGVGTAARLNNPWSLAFHYPSNSLFVMDGGNHVIRRVR